MGILSTPKGAGGTGPCPVGIMRLVGAFAIFCYFGLQGSLRDVPPARCYSTRHLQLKAPLYTIGPVKGRIFYAITHFIGCLLAWRSRTALESSLLYTYELGSLPRAPHCGDPVHHMLEPSMFPRTVLSTRFEYLSTELVESVQKKKIKRQNQDFFFLSI